MSHIIRLNIAYSKKRNIRLKKQHLVKTTLKYYN